MSKKCETFTNGDIRPIPNIFIKVGSLIPSLSLATTDVRYSTLFRACTHQATTLHTYIQSHYPNHM